MKFPPAWKIKRELLSFSDQVKSWFLIILSPILLYFYEKKELTEIEVCDGQRNFSEKLVLFLIYQPHGVMPSCFESIDFIVSQGYEILLISNGFVSEVDLEKLNKNCWRIIQRKNLGYDFGGYRCGLNYLKNNNINPKILTLINDSIWFPVLPESNIFLDTENIMSDFCGAVYLKNQKKAGDGIALSYWLTLKGQIPESKNFQEFWRQYFPTSNKTMTVKLGERALSRHMHLAGHAVDGVFTTDNFLTVLKSSTAQNLRLALKYGSFTDASFETECQRLLSISENTDLWRGECLDFIGRVAEKRNFLHSFCFASIFLLRVPFLKKNNMRLQVLMRRKYLEAVRAGDLPLPPISIFKEIEESIGLPDQSVDFK
jgi:hypothetical protein